MPGNVALKIRAILLLLGLWAVAACPLLGQDSLRGPSDRPMLQLSFDRQNNFTFSTNLQTYYALERGRYSLDLRLVHSNIYNNAREEDRLVQLYVHSDIWQHFRLHARLDLASWIETDQYVNGQNAKYSGYAGVRYRPIPSLSITPLVGYTWDTRTAILGRTEPHVELDQGFTPALLVKSEHTWADNLSMYTSLVARYKSISPRRQHNLGLDHVWTKEFEEGVTLMAGLHASSNELDDYQGNSVKRILSDTLMPSLNLGYVFLPGLEWQSSNSFLLHRRRFLFQNLVLPQAEENDLTFKGLEISTIQRLILARQGWRASASYEFMYSSRSYFLDNDMGLNDTDYELAQERERQKDFLKNFHRLEVTAALPIGQRQRLEGVVTNQYLQYDTPSETNFDDRDELSWVVSGRWVSNWSRSFRTSGSLLGNYRHYAFLLKEKSQDNYVQRSLRMDFDYAWDVSERWRFEGQQSIYVTYNVKDFTDYNRTDRSTRNLESNAKLTWRPRKRLQGELSFRRKETHQSFLNWAAFSETTLDTNRILTVENRWRVLLTQPTAPRQWYLEGGYKHFDQTKRQKANMVGYDNQLKAISHRKVSLQSGPVFALGYRDRNLSTIDVGLWLQIQVQKDTYDILATNQIFGAAQQQADLDRVGIEFRPYPTAKINYYFGGKK